MSTGRKLSAELRTLIKNVGIRAVSRETGVPVPTVSRAVNSGRASVSVLQKLERTERIKDRLRHAEEINTSVIIAPRRESAVVDWSIEAIRSARDAQMRGDFKYAVRLAEAMKTDDAIFTAFHNRLAPQSAVMTELRAAPGARGEATKRRAQTSCIVPAAVLMSIHATLVDHGIAIGYVKQETNEDGTRVDFELTEWPLEHVKYNESTEQLETRTKDGGGMVPIVHGDGRWIVFRKSAVLPWKRGDACVLPGGMIWGAHQYGISDWAAAAKSHGKAKVIGTLPDGFALQDENGDLTPEAKTFLQMLADVLEGEAGAGLAQFGSKAEFVSNNSTAWQVFSELVGDRKKAAAYIYLGTDATLGAQGGAPGVDISMLFGVATTKVQGDFKAIQAGLRTGLYEPWCALNEGDSRNAPTLVYLLPDPDTEQKIAQEDTRRKAFFDALDRYTKSGMIVTQETVNALAKAYNIEAPTLAPAAQKAVKLDITPSDVAKVFTINEVRASQGGAPLETPRGKMTIPQAEEADKAAAAATAAAAEAKTQPAAEPPSPTA